MMIYFCQRADGDIKIGTSRAVWTRKAALEPKHGKLTLLGVVEGGIKEERGLHSLFSSARREGTEFFAPCAELLNYIHSNAVPLAETSYGYRNLVVKWKTKKRAERMRVALRLAMGRPVHTDELVNILFDVASAGRTPAQFARDIARAQKEAVES